VKQAQAGHYAAETLVYFIKKYHGYRSIYEALFRSLLEQHVFPPLSHAFRGFSRDRIHDLRQHVVLKIVEAIARTDGRGDFTQVHFGRYLKMRALTARAAAVREVVRERTTVPLSDLLAEDNIQPEGIYAAENSRSLVGRALRCLPKPLRRLLVERHVKEMGVGSDDWKSDDTATLARKYEKSGRTIRTRLRDGEKRMRVLIRRWIGEL
jgi:DNA-directed RNA polymerase specialized sigma24 family protein